jgi:hypothetical protein
MSNDTKYYSENRGLGDGEQKRYLIGGEPYKWTCLSLLAVCVLIWEGFSAGNKNWEGLSVGNREGEGNDWEDLTSQACEWLFLLAVSVDTSFVVKSNEATCGSSSHLRGRATKQHAGALDFTSGIFPRGDSSF